MLIYIYWNVQIYINFTSVKIIEILLHITEMILKKKKKQIQIQFLQNVLKKV